MTALASPHYDRQSLIPELHRAADDMGEWALLHTQSMALGLIDNNLHRLAREEAMRKQVIEESVQHFCGYSFCHCPDACGCRIDTSEKLTVPTARLEMETWVERRKRRDGDYDLIVMCRSREYDETGALVDEKTEETGMTGWAPGEFAEMACAPNEPEPITLRERLRDLRLRWFEWL